MFKIDAATANPIALRARIRTAARVAIPGTSFPIQTAMRVRPLARPAVRQRVANRANKATS